MTGAPRARAGFLLALFFASGFAALLYQMIWQRILTLFGGADVYSVTIIVAAFMAGLGFGSLAGGYLADRLTLRGRFAAFATAELAIALFAFASVPLFYDVLFQRMAPLGLSRVVTAAVLFAALLWPTFFMGLSLPLLAKAGAGGLRSSSGDWIGRLYGMNTLGAAIGSLVTVWVLARLLGFAGAVHVGCALNLACAAGGGLLAFRASGEPETEEERHEVEEKAASPATFSFPVWILLYALSGFIALSLEIVWFRVLGIVLKSNSFTFGSLLALYLTGVGAGALLAGRGGRLVRDPGAGFLALQSGIALYAGLSLALFTAAVPRLGFLAPLWRYLGDYEALDVGLVFRDPSALTSDAVLLFVVLYLVVPAFLVGVPTLLMGASFTLLQRATQTEPGLLGRRLGWLQTSNIVGSTLGTVITGLGLLHVLGTASTLRLLMGLAGVFLLLLVGVRCREAGRGLWAASSAAVAAVGFAMWLSPSSAMLWARLHGTTPSHVIAEEDGSGLSVLKQHPRPEIATSVFVDGLGQSRLPYGGGHTLLGMLPVLVHPHPRSVALLGLGSGDTVFSAGGRQETERIDCIEIVRPQIDTLRQLERRRIYPGLTALLTDPRVQYTFTDGRAFLGRGRVRYDVIEADALRPTSAYSGNLYSLEYFQMIRAHLSPGGFGVTWAPTRRILNTFLSAFPYALRFDDVLIGSETPILFDIAAVRARLADPFTRDYYQRGGIDDEAEVRKTLSVAPTIYLPTSSERRATDVNTDLFPKDEYSVPQASAPARLAIN